MDIKKYKKEQKNQSFHKKVSDRIGAFNDELKSPMNMRAKLKGIKEHKEKMASKMAKDQVDLDVHEEKEKRGYGKRANY